MRIVLICRNYPPAICGVGDHTYFVAHEMAQLGHEVTVFTSERPDVRRHEGITVRTIGGEWAARTIPSILEGLASTDPDALYLQYVPHMYGHAGVAPWTVSLARAIRRRFRSKLIVIFHELYVPWSASARLLAGGVIHRWQAASLIHLVHASAVTTPRRRDTMRRWMPLHAGKISEIPVGSNIPVVPLSNGERSALRTQLGANEAPLIGAFGTLKPDERNHDLLFASLARVRRVHPDARFVWIGSVDRDSPEFALAAEKALRFGVGDVVQWTGCLSAEDTSRHLSSLDVFLSLQAEGPCFRRGSLLAAMDHGLPIVALDGRATDPRLEHATHMMLVGPNPESVADNLHAVLSSPELSTRLRLNVKELTDRTLQWPGIARQLLMLAE